MPFNLDKSVKRGLTRDWKDSRDFSLNPVRLFAAFSLSHCLKRLACQAVGYLSSAWWCLLKQNNKIQSWPFQLEVVPTSATCWVYLVEQQAPSHAWYAGDEAATQSFRSVTGIMGYHLINVAAMKTVKSCTPVNTVFKRFNSFTPKQHWQWSYVLNISVNQLLRAIF